MFKALFLDRDGVINEDLGYLHKVEDVKFKPYIFDLCRYARSLGYMIVVVTNQSGIARGYFTEFEFHNLMNWMRGIFIREKCSIDAIYYCPFHPDGSLISYTRTSEYRKPNPGMLLEAKKHLDLELPSCILIGDQESDIKAALNAGVGTTILFHQATHSTEATYTVRSLAHAIKIIKKMY